MRRRGQDALLSVRRRFFLRKYRGQNGVYVVTGTQPSALDGRALNDAEVGEMVDILLTRPLREATIWLVITRNMSWYDYWMRFIGPGQELGQYDKIVYVHNVMALRGYEGMKVKIVIYEERPSWWGEEAEAALELLRVKHGAELRYDYA